MAALPGSACGIAVTLRWVAAIDIPGSGEQSLVGATKHIPRLFKSFLLTTPQHYWGVFSRSAAV